MSVLLIENPGDAAAQCKILIDTLELTNHFVRQLTKKYMSLHHFSDEKIGDAVIVAGELIKNLIPKHNTTYEPDEVQVEITVSPSQWQLRVRDHQSGIIIPHGSCPIPDRDIALFDENSVGLGWPLIYKLSKPKILVNEDGKHEVVATISNPNPNPNCY